MDHIVDLIVGQPGGAEGGEAVGSHAPGAERQPDDVAEDRFLSLGEEGEVIELLAQGGSSSGRGQLSSGLAPVPQPANERLPAGIVERFIGVTEEPPV